mmetsp:Transcript_5629/g.4839  ORF Transcript_5629/g.4839 Transcript_5629/m.4839 type:complete len:101 (+) Transcript_5629:130-432(+)
MVRNLRLYLKRTKKLLKEVPIYHHSDWSINNLDSKISQKRILKFLDTKSKLLSLALNFKKEGDLLCFPRKFLNQFSKAVKSVSLSNVRISKTDFQDIIRC